MKSWLATLSLLALSVGCGTLGGPAGGGDNLPTAWIIPFDELTDEAKAPLAPLTLPDEFSAARAPWVVIEGSGYLMYLALKKGDSEALYRATSSDGRQFTLESGAILEPSAPLLGMGITAPTVVKHDGSYRLWFATIDGRGIGTATSSDGRQFTLHPELVLTGSLEWERGADNAFTVATPSVLRVGDTFHIWYTGGDGNAIGHATSSDGVTWSKDAEPLLRRGKSGTWNAAFVGAPRVTAVKLVSGRTIYRMYFTGRGNRNAIGFAGSFDALAWSEFAQNPVFELGDGVSAAHVLPYLSGALMFFEKTVQGKTTIGIAGHRVQ